MAHVIVATPDTFFIEEVYKNSTLEGCAKYMLVDYFDRETTIGILLEEGFSKEEAEFTWDWVGGRPWELAEVVEAKRRGKLKETINELYRATFGRLEDMIARASAESGKKLIESLRLFLNNPSLKSRSIPDPLKETVSNLVEEEILFYDPLSGEVKPQTRLMERAIKELLK